MVDIPGCLCYHILCWDSEVSIGKPMAEHRNRWTCVRLMRQVKNPGEPVAVKTERTPISYVTGRMLGRQGCAP